MSLQDRRAVTPYLGREVTVEERRSRRRRTRTWALAAGAVALAATALVVQTRARRAERDNPPWGRFVDVDGVRLHYVDRGRGEPLVLLHGNGSMSREFEISGLIDEAARRFRVIAFDRPGHGYSTRPREHAWTPEAQADLLDKALDRLGAGQALVLGHSWGALVALALALDHPERVRALVLASGYYFPTPRLDVLLLSPPALPVVGDVMRYTISPLLGWLMLPAIMRRIFGPAPMPERFAAFPFGLALRPSQIRASAADTALMIPAAWRLRRRYPRLAVPAVIIAGGGDLLVDAGRQSVRLHRVVPDSALRVISGVGHMVQQNAPEQVMAAIDLAARRSAKGSDVDAAAPAT